MYALIEAPEGDRQDVTLLTVKRQLWASSCPIKVTTRELYGPSSARECYLHRAGSTFFFTNAIECVSSQSKEYESPDKSRDHGEEVSNTVE